MSGIKIYVGCALNDIPESEKKVFLLKISNLKDGLIKKGHTVLEFRGIGSHEDGDVYKTDIGNVYKCDLFVAVCDFASTGLGIEIGKAFCLNKPVLLLSMRKVSKMVTGSAKVEKNASYERYKSTPGMIRFVQTEIVRLGLRGKG